MRKATRAFTVGDYTIPEGWMIFASFRGAHITEYGMEAVRDGCKHMTFEEGFDPDRWFDEKRRPQQWFGFGYGPVRKRARAFCMYIRLLFEIPVYSAP